jgi:WS/DGAT/MGAT family acyltransferase
MRALGKRVDASVNDVLLAVCGHALQRYLERLNSLPDTPLIAGVPVSLRQRSDRRFNNQVSLMRAPLETLERDPLQRLRRIAAGTRQAKALLEDSRGLLTPPDLHVPGLAEFSRGFGSLARQLNWPAAVDPVCNVLISNVPGPKKTRYLLGAEMLTHYPVSIAADTSALNITAQSYRGRMDLGLTACLETVPDVQSLREDIETAWQALEQAAASGVASVA